MLNFHRETAQPDDVLAILADAGLSGCGEDLKDAMLSYQKGLNISVILYKKRTLWPAWSYDRCQLDDEVRLPWEDDASTVTLWHDDEAATHKRPKATRIPYPPAWVYFRFAEMALRLAHERTGMVAPKSFPFVDSEGHKHNVSQSTDKKQLDGLRRRLITHFKHQISKLEKAARRAEARAAKYTSPKSRIAKKMAQEIVRMANQRAAMQQEIFALTGLEDDAKACDKDSNAKSCVDVKGKLHRSAEKVPAAVVVPVTRQRPPTKDQQQEIALRDWIMLIQRNVPDVPVITDHSWTPKPVIGSLMRDWHPDGERQAQARRRVWNETVWNLLGPTIDAAQAGEPVAQKIVKWAVGDKDLEKVLRDGERHITASRFDEFEKLLRIRDPRIDDSKTYSRDRAALEKRNAIRESAKINVQIKNPCKTKTGCAATVKARVGRVVASRFCSARGARARAS